MNLWGFLSGLVKSDCVILGGGTHFHDDYPKSRLARHALYLGRILLFQLIAKMFGRRVLWIGVGIGPLTKDLFELLTLVGCRLTDGVSVRDDASFRELRKIGYEGKLILGSDLAMLLPVDAEVVRRPRRLGISVTESGKLSPNII